MQFISKAKLSNFKRAFVRADLDVPISPEGEVLETFRLDKLKPTVELLQENNVHPVLAGHIGRPKNGEQSSELSTSNLKPLFDEWFGAEHYSLLENLRFNSKEKERSEDFAEELASQADIYINESFATSHRDSTSMTLVPSLLPAYAGLQLEKELKNLSKVSDSKESPKIAVVGGVKESKKEAIYLLAEKFDRVLVVGKLQKEEEDPEKDNVVYPLDYSGDGFDIGPKTSEKYSKEIFDAKIVIWAGPAGAYDKGFFEGSRKIAKAVLSSQAFSVVGGGDTIACLNQLNLLDDFDFVSTGGGAMLDFLSGKNLPALESLGYYE